MAKKKREALNEEQSPAALVLERERQLKLTLDEAAKEAERLVSSARAEAEERLRAAREDIPRTFERRLRDGLSRLGVEAASGEKTPREVEREVGSAAEANFRKAVDAIVAAVLPGAGS